MHKLLPPCLRIPLFSLLLAIFSITSAFAQTIYGISGNSLVSFSATNPTSFQSSVQITGIADDQTISGLDFRPNTGQLYTIGYNDSTGVARLYTINLTTGVATPVGNAAVNLLPGMGRISFDFNPTVDRIRVTGSNGANYRLHPVTGAIAATDTNLAFATTDINADSTALIGAVAYTNSFPGTGTTTLYNYDVNLNILTTQNPPNNGTLNTVGAIGPGFFGTASSTDLDIYFDPTTGTNTAYLIRNDSSTTGTTLYTVNLTTGAATSVGVLADGSVVDYIAVQTTGVTTAPITGYLVYALTTNNNLISFDSDQPEQLQSIVSVTGITAGQTLSGIDFRPATGDLYGLGYNATTGAARIYTINITTGVATAVGDSAITLGVGLGNIGFDFNPTVDRIRVTGSNGNNFRLNPITGAVAATDSTLNFASGDANQGNGSIGASAYTNSFTGSTTTTLYNISQTLGILTTQNPPNNGTLNTVGTLGIQLDTTDRSFDLDILYDQTTQTNIAFLAANTLGGTSDVLYQVNLTTGATTLVGNIGSGVPIRSIAVVLDSVPTQPQDTSGVDLAVNIYGISGTNLVNFSTLGPDSAVITVPITGIAAGYKISGLDFRPNTGQLYTIGYNNSTGVAQLYTLNLTTGAATSVGATIALLPNMGAISFDFNPTVDRIRVTGSNGSNYRLNPVTGAIAATDTNLAFATTDVNAGSTSSIGAVAYTNSYPGTGTTTLYNYDVNLNILTTQNPPNNGTLNTIGSVGPIFSGTATSTDLDIYFDPATGTNTAYFVRNDSSAIGSDLYTLNLTTGMATLLGNLDSVVVDYIAVQIPGITTAPVTGNLVYALTTNNNLVSFDSENPEQLQSIVSVSGITAGEMLVGIDFRPATSGLYGLGYNMTTGAARIYTINTTTGAATAVGDSAITLGVGLGNIGFDFNPTVDRIRVTGSNGGNFRLNPITGAIAATDSTLNFASGDANQGNGSIGASAYTNSFNGTTTTTLYNISQSLGILTTQNPPNNGTLNTVGALGIQLDTTDRSFDLDILYNQTTQTNIAFLAANTLGSTSDALYQVNLATGATTLVGTIGGGVPIKSIAVVLDSVPQPQDTSGVDLALTVSATPINYAQYVDVTYTITVTNTGSETADSVTVAAGLTNGLVYTSSSVTQGEYNLYYERWDVGTLAPGQSATLTLVLFPLVKDSSITNYFEVLTASGDDSDSTPGNGNGTTANEDDEAVISIIGPPQPPQGGQNADLSLFASVDSTNYNIYENVTYHLVLVNNGPDAADSISVSAGLPQNVVYTSSSTTGAGDYNLFYQRWNVSYLAAGDTAFLDLTLFPLIDSVNIDNFFQVMTSGQDDPDSTPGNDTNNTPNEDDEVLITLFDNGQPPVTGADTADLSITVAVDSITYTAFQNITYHVVVRNSGPDDATNVSVSAELPDGFSYTSAATNSGQYNSNLGIWNLDVLTSGDSAFMDLVVFPLVDTADIVSYFEILTSDQDDPDSTPGNGNGITANEDDEAVITLTGNPVPQGGVTADLSLFVTTDSTVYSAFTNLTYNLMLVNNGPDNASGITVSIGLPEGFSYTSDSLTTGQYDPFSGIWNVGFLANGDTVYLDITAFPLTDSLQVTAYFEILTSDQDDPNSTPGNGANNEDDQVQITLTITPNFIIDPSQDRFSQSSPYSDVVLYPVPAAEFITLQMNSLEARESQMIYIFNQSGSLVRTQSTTVAKGDNKWTFEVNQLAAGTYFIQLPGERKVLKFIKL